MIKKIKASKSEKIILIFILFLGTFSFSSFFLIKDKCIFIKNYDPKKISFKNPNNIAILNSLDREIYSDDQITNMGKSIGEGCKVDKNYQFTI